jgi:TPR repeat protein
MLLNNADAAYKAALEGERKKDRKSAITNFQIASDNGHLLATLRLAQVFDDGILGFSPDRPTAALYFKRAAALTEIDQTLSDVYKRSQADGIVFLSLMAKAFLLASESGRLSVYAYQAVRYFSILELIDGETYVDEPESFAELSNRLSKDNLTAAQESAEAWLNR